MDKYLFIKMLYLSDREALEKWEEPITGDTPTSMQYGPVLSGIYDLTKGDYPSARSDWEPYIADCDAQTNRITLLGDPGQSELSRAEVTLLESVFQKFRNFTWRDMRDFCHKLQEYEDVGKSSKPISTERILSAVGKSETEIEQAESRFRHIAMADMLLGIR